MFNGDVNGLLLLYVGMCIGDWVSVMQVVYDEMNVLFDCDFDVQIVIDFYVVEDLVEFFVVISEYFFIVLDFFYEVYLVVYWQFQLFYCQDLL